MDPTVTYNMNILQHLTLDRTVCVSLNSQERIASEHVIDEFTYAHPVYDQSALCAQDRKDEISGTGNVYYAGAYWGNGFHEDGVVSAMDVARRLGVEWSP
jgi:predicted NAD/FAD-binding protein